MPVYESDVYGVCRSRGKHNMTNCVVQTAEGQVVYQVCQDCHLRFYPETGYVEVFDILPTSTPLPKRH